MIPEKKISSSVLEGQATPTENGQFHPASLFKWRGGRGGWGGSLCLHGPSCLRNTEIN